MGGSTDMSYFYEKHPGHTLNAALDLHVHLTINPSFDNSFIIHDKQIQKVAKISEVSNSRVRAVLEHFKVKSGLEIIASSDVPMGGTGLGASSSFTVALIQGIGSLQGKKFTSRQLAELACHIEIDVLHEPIGKQDQYAAVMPGANLTTYKKGGKASVESVNWSKKTKAAFEDRLVFIYLGKEHSSKIY